MDYLLCSTDLGVCFLCQYHTFLINITLWYSLHSGHGASPALFFISKLLSPNQRKYGYDMIILQDFSPLTTVLPY